MGAETTEYYPQFFKIDEAGLLDVDIRQKYLNNVDN